MIRESVNSDQKEKEEDLLNGNLIINLKNLITDVDKFLVCKECAKQRELRIKLEEERDVEKVIDYVEDCFQLTPSDDQKRARKLHEDFKKQTYNRRTTSHQNSF